MIAPVFKSASIAICLPGIASKVNLAVTSATRSEPLLITTNCTIIKIINTTTPSTRSPPPTNCPNVATTFPGLPVDKIKRVDDTFNAILKIVVNSKIVGKNDKSKTSFANIVVNRMVNASEMLIASNTSSIVLLIGTINMMIAQRRYSATPMSAFFILMIPP